MNSLTANNRLSQQLVVSVAAHLLLRHECRLPNHLAVSNHREQHLTVGLNCLYDRINDAAALAGLINSLLNSSVVRGRMRANQMKQILTESLPCQGINSQFDSLFFNFEPLFQVFEFFSKSKVLLCNSIFSNQVGCQFCIGVFRIINIYDISIFSCNNGNTVLTHCTHFTSHTSAFYFELAAIIADGYIVKTITSAAVSQKLVSHVVSPYFDITVNPHPRIIIDHELFRVYTASAPEKSGAGIGVLKLSTAMYDAPASFLSSAFAHIQIMVGWAGAPKGAPVSVDAGYANPVQFTTSEIGVSGGGSFSLSTEAAIMATIQALTQPEITIDNGQAVTTSLAVANFFSKRHDDVLKKIRTLDCSPEFCARNFAETSISVNQPNGGTRKLPCYQITRDGFAFLAMGFTGKRAARFKEAYINAFNQMEKQLSNPSVLSDVAYNASVLYSYISSIHQVWLQQLYPMLAKAESPLAVSLYDRINDAALLASLINLSLNPSEVRGRK